MAFSQKRVAKRLLKRILVENEDYEVTIPKKKYGTTEVHGSNSRLLCSSVQKVTVHESDTETDSEEEKEGRPSELIKLTYDASQKFCLKAQTKNAMEFADCFTSIIKAITDFHRLSAYVNPLLFRHNDLAK